MRSERLSLNSIPLKALFSDLNDLNALTPGKFEFDNLGLGALVSEVLHDLKNFLENNSGRNRSGNTSGLSDFQVDEVEEDSDDQDPKDFGDFDNDGPNFNFTEAPGDTTPPLITLDLIITSSGLRGVVNDPTATITVIVNDIAYEATNNGDGTWTLLNDDVSLAVQSGAVNVTVIAEDPAGNKVTVTADSFEDKLAPEAPGNIDLIAGSDTGVLDSDNLTKDTTPTLTGTGVNGDTITLYDTDGVTVLGTTLVAGGVWSITASPALSEGIHSLTVTATDSSNNVSPPSSTLILTIDTIAPPIPASPLDLLASSDTGVLDNDEITMDKTPTVTGVGSDGNLITLYDTDGITVLGTAIVVGGIWSITTSALSDGVHGFTATATDAAGNESDPSASLAVTIDAAPPAQPISPPSLNIASDTGGSNSDNITKDTTPTFNGTGTVGETITLYENGISLGTAVVDGSGNWSITVDPALDPNTYSFTTTATDLAGNESDPSASLDITVDTMGELPTINLLTTANTSPIVTGTAEPNSYVDVTLTSPDEVIILGTVQADGSGKWSIDLSVEGGTGLVLDAGVIYDATLTSTDLAGNAAVYDMEGSITDEIFIDVGYSEYTLDPAVFNSGNPLIGCHLEPQFSGTLVNATDTVTLTLNGVVYNATIDGMTWSVNNIPALDPLTTYTVTLTTTDVSSAVTLDEVDLITGERIYVSISGTEAGENIIGGNAENSIVSDNDCIHGLGGNDSLQGKGANDFLHGGSGDDILSGQTGNDILFGGTGEDDLDGGFQDDTLFGGAGNDTLNGNKGVDLLYGGKGDDELTGGADIDTFAWYKGAQGTTSTPAEDTITDFESGEKIDLSSLLIGENEGNILNFMFIEYQDNPGGNNDKTAIYINTAGALGASGANADQIIYVDGIDLTGGNSSATALVSLIEAGTIVIDV